jgi:hypothetical protein
MWQLGDVHGQRDAERVDRQACEEHCDVARADPGAAPGAAERPRAVESVAVQRAGAERHDRRGDGRDAGADEERVDHERDRRVRRADDEVADELGGQCSSRSNSRWSARPTGVRVG